MPFLASTSRYFADHLLFAVGLFAGSQLPVFINQYRQRVGGMLDQARIDLQPFQAIAEKWHGGSLDALVQHHLNSSDPTFYAEGQAISAMASSVERLSDNYAAMEAGFLQQLAYLATHYDPQLGVATWQVFTPGISFTLAAIVFALLAGYSLSLLFRGGWFAVGQLTRFGLRSKRKATPRRRDPIYRDPNYMEPVISAVPPVQSEVEGSGAVNERR